MAVALFVLGLLLAVNILNSEGSEISGLTDRSERNLVNGQTSDNLVHSFGTQPESSGWTATNNEWRKAKPAWNGYGTPKNVKYITRTRLRNAGYSAATARQCSTDLSSGKSDFGNSYLGQWERPRQTLSNNGKQRYWQ